MTSVQQFIVALHVKSGLVDFAKKYMFSMINDVGIIHPLCFRLITENYDGKAFVGMGNNYNFVDFAADSQRQVLSQIRPVPFPCATP